MNLKSLAIAPLIAFAITGCGVTDLAKNAAKTAADATACTALGSTITSLADAYQSGLVDSGVITKIDNLVGEQARALLSTGLAEDLKMLTDSLGQTQTADGSKEKVKEITDSITQRCSEAGVDINQ